MRDAKPLPEVMSFLFHEVTDSPSTTGFQTPGAAAYKHGCRQFEDNLRVIAMAQEEIALVTKLDSASDGGRLILLTFDDGGKSAMHIADRIESRGWRGHFFVTTNQIGTKYFLSAGEIRELCARGHIVGAHTHTHSCPFMCLSRERQIQEFADSIKVLTDIIQEEVTTGSIPGGDATRETFQNIAETGLRYCFTSEPTTRPTRIGGTVFLGRVCPKNTTPVETVAQLAKFRGILRQQPVRFAKRVVKRIVYSFRGVSASPFERHE
jgi:peptidoglycan/xylan/chitin deacetylase (PgdA/CDA1 family)